MTLDYITVGISIAVFILYLMIFFLLIGIKRKLTRDAGRAFVYIMVAFFFLIIRRLQQIFIESDILHPVTYSSDVVTFIFAIFFFLGVLSFYRSLKKAGSSGRGTGESFSDYKRNLGRKIIR